MRLAGAFVVLLLLSACAGTPTTPETPKAAAPQPPLTERLDAAVGTVAVSDDPDDPAIWVHSADASQSIVVGTNKVEKPDGALVVFDLQGKILQTIGNLDRPNNVDIEYAVTWNGKTADIAAVAERKAGAVRIYTIDPKTRRLSEAAKARVFAGETGDAAEPMGIAIYKRRDGAVFVIVGRKSGPAEGYIWQYRIQPGPSLELVRKFGKYSGSGEIEAIAVDDALGFVYYADETAGIRKYHADPDAAGAAQELAFFGQSGYRADREGIGVYATGDGVGYIVSTDQIEGTQGGSRYLLYRREGAKGNPHDHSEVVAVLEGGADATDGIEVLSTALSPLFPNGLLVAMNSGPRNFLFYGWPQAWAAGGERQ